MDKRLQIINFKLLRLKSQQFDLTINIMKSKLILYYEVVFNSLYYKYYKDEEKSRKLAFGVVRNAIGVIIFMLSIVLFVVVMCVFSSYMPAT